jgi:transcriptional regulator with XRE-family HTH domain
MLSARVRAYLRFIGANLQRLRTRAKITQEEVAARTGLDVRFLRRLERGSVNIRFDTLVRVADALGVEPGVLLRRAKPSAAKPGRPRKGGSVKRTARRSALNAS